MIEVENLSYSRGGRTLYSASSFTVDDGCHCVLIGGNGSGKSTLIDLFLNPEDYLFKGKVRLGELHRVGYVNQFIESEKERPVTVLDYLSEDFRQIQSEMDALCEDLDADGAMEAYQHCLDEFMAVDGYNYDVNIRRQLRLAGIEHTENVTLDAISGGEYKLVQVIRQMLRLPELLVMDEPDVFLDYENLLGMRRLINSHSGTMLVATHNRYLLNNCFDKVLQIENTAITEYDGTYMDFCLTRLQMKIARQELSQKESDFIAFEETVVERLRDEATKVISPQKGRTLHARVSYLERWKKRHTEEPYLDSRCPEIRFPTVEPSGEYAIKAENYGVTFDKTLLENVSFLIMPGDKAALVGPNGSGKTTLLRDIWRGENKALSTAPGIKTDFLSQFHGETLSEECTVWELLETMGFERRADGESYLSRYCFEPDVLDQPIRTLSGGEKNMLQLARIGGGEGELLLLDEPTSHLDLPSQTALEQAIRDYRGTVLLVSHDFYTVANCADYVLYAESGTVRRMSIRAFRKMIYKNYFPVNYLEQEQKKKELEAQINARLLDGDYAAAGVLCRELEDVIESMTR